MAAAVGALRVEASANAARFERDIGRIRRATTQSGREMATSMQRFRTSVNNAVSSIFSLRTAAVAAAGATGLFMVAQRAIATADEIGKMAREVGTSAESLQELRFAASQSGIASGDLDTALRNLNQRLGDTTEESGPAKDALEDLGIAMEDIEDLDIDEVLELIADRMKDVDDPARRAAIATSLFGRAGHTMGRLLMEGADAIRTLRDRARDLGIVLDNETIEKAEQANNELGEMREIFRVLTLRIALEFMPLMRQLAQTVSSPEFVEGTRSFASGIADAMQWVGRHGETLLRILLAAKGASLGGRIGGLPGAAVGGALGGLAPEIFRALTGSAREEVDNLEAEIQRAERVLAEFQERIAGIELRLGSGELTAQQRRQSEQALTDLQAGAVEKLRELNELEARRAEILAEATEETERAVAPVTDYTTALREAEQALTPATDRVADSTEALRRQNDQIEELLGAMRNLPGEVDALREAQELENAARAQNIDLSTDQGEAWAEQYRRGQQLTRALEDVERLTRAVADPVKDHARDIERLTELYDDGTISINQFNEGVRLADERLADATQRAGELTEGMDDLGDAIDRMPGLTRDMEMAFSGAMRSMILSGNSLREVMGNLLEDIINVAIYSAVIQPVGQALGGAVSGFFGGLFGFRTGGQFEVGGVGGADSQVVAFKATPGELVTVQTPGQQANVSPSVTLQSMTEVHVHSAAGTSPAVRESQGGRRIDVYMDESMAAAIRPGTRTYRALRDQFDMGQRLARR